MGLDFNVALTGLSVGEKMISVAQNNIANAQNSSYARQRAEVNVIGITQGTSGVNSQLGSGAIVEEISRIRDELFIQQSRTELGSIGYYSAAKDVLSNIETVFNETGENSISDLMQNFFNSFEEVSKFPEQSSYRLSAIYSGKMLSDKLRGVTQQLDEVKNQTDQKLTTEVTQVNELLKKIANVNKRIESVQTDKPNALMDERDKYLDELSSYVDVQVKYTTKPQDMTIKVGNATLLAGTNTYDVKPMYVKERDEWVLGASDVQFKPAAGSLAGTLNTRNGYIATYQNDLNKLVNNLINEVNTIHNSGYGMDGSTGLDFFQGTDSRTIKINSVLESSPEKLALSSENGVIGNSELAKAISDLKEKPFMDSKPPANFYQEYTSRLAMDLNIAKQNEEIHTDIQKSLESQRQEVQGVNVDEEMSNLLMVQKFYQANAKTLSTTKDMLDQLFSII